MMRRFILLAIVGMFVSTGCSRQKAPTAARDDQAASTTATNDLQVGQPLIHGNLAIFPVLSETPRMADRFITLDEGLKAGTIEILEMSAEGAGNAQPDAEQASVNLNAIDLEANQQAEQTAEAPSVRPQPAAQEENTPPAPNPPAPNDDPFGGPDNDPFGGNDPFGDSFAVQQAAAQQIPNLGNVMPHGRGNEVNRLVVINRSDRPLYLMPGEVIVGGDQDRTIGEELVIQPDGKPTPIAVFCVEHGRWGGRSQPETVALFSDAGGDDDGAGMVAGLSLVVSQSQSLETSAGEAGRGKFVGSAGQLSKAVRMAVVASKSQGTVWDEVAQINAHSNVQTESDSFTANYTDAQAVARLEPYVKQLASRVSESENVVGVIVAIDGEIQTMDVFESTPLFQKLWPKLLKSYALDAANAATDDPSDDPPCSREDAARFLADAFQADVEDSSVEKGIAVTRRTSDRIVSFSASHLEETPLSDDLSEGASAMGGFGGGGALHTSAFAQ